MAFNSTQPPALPWGQATYVGGARAHLLKAFELVKRLPDNADLRLDLAEKLVEVKQLDQACHHAKHALKVAQEGWEYLEAAADLLLELGAFKAAHKACETLLKREPENANAMASLAALLENAGEHEAATGFIKASARAKPYEMPNRLEKERPTVLRIRAVDHSKYTLKRSKRTGLYRTGLARGHFSIKSLVRKREINLILVSLTEGFMPPVDHLPKIDAIINTVSCADRYADALEQMDSFLAGLQGIPIINEPGRVLLTSRAQMAARLGSLKGVRFPATHLITRSSNIEADLAAIESLLGAYPIIMREAGTQTGISVSRVDDREQLEVYLAGVPAGKDLYAIEYIDCKGADGFFHKTRAFFIDGQFYPVANLSSDEWQIHSGDRYRIMDKTPATQVAEQHYLADPKGYLGAGVFDALHRIRDEIQLDFFGIDFTVTRTGQLVVFEANAAMRHNFDHATAFPYTRAHLQTISRAFNAMLHKRIAPVDEGV